MVEDIKGFVTFLHWNYMSPIVDCLYGRCYNQPTCRVVYLHSSLNVDGCIGVVYPQYWLHAHT